jgi:cytochrome b6-f complex iron-sulfur subunit
LSTKDILAAARAQAASGAASAPAPQAEAPAAPPQPAAEAPAAPAAKPVAGKKPTSTADILAAARAQAAGSAAPAASAGAPAPAVAAPAAKPKPAAGGAPKSTADILAAARAAATGKRTAAETGAVAKPAKAEQASPAVPAAAMADASAGPRLSVQEMLAAVRPGAVAPEVAVVGAAPAKPVKPTVAPPMPAKPLPVAKAPAPDAGRRNVVLALLAAPFALIGGLFGSAFAAAWTTLAATTGIATLATARFMLPNVLTEPPRKFKIGPPADFDLGTVATKLVAQYGVWIVHTDQYKGKNLIYALISVCTHLGCTPSWLEGERKFKCPCHGSGFYVTGINFEGPAPRPLERAGIKLAADGMLEVDKSVKFQEEMGQWADPASYYEVVG